MDDQRSVDAITRRDPAPYSPLDLREEEGEIFFEQLISEPEADPSPVMIDLYHPKPLPEEQPWRRLFSRF